MVVMSRMFKLLLDRQCLARREKGLLRQVLDAGLDLADTEAIELTPTRVVHTPEVTHVRYTVGGRAALVLAVVGAA